MPGPSVTLRVAGLRGSTPRSLRTRFGGAATPLLRRSEKWRPNGLPGGRCSHRRICRPWSCDQPGKRPPRP